MSAALDLFGAPAVAGLALGEAFVTAIEEAQLIARIDAADLSPFRFQQWTGKRLTRSFGWTYDFEKGSFAPADPIPSWLAGVRDRAARFAGLDPAALVQALVIRYDPGAGIGWHKDRPVFEHVVGLSLGSTAAMRLRRRTDTGFARRSVPLAPRSIYHLAGEVRRHWEHSLAPVAVPRWSVTFRSLAQ
jgi:alkylated DNA repair dioxygenase AlkB